MLSLSRRLPAYLVFPNSVLIATHRKTLRRFALRLLSFTLILLRSGSHVLYSSFAMTDPVHNATFPVPQAFQSPTRQLRSSADQSPPEYGPQHRLATSHLAADIYNNVSLRENARAEVTFLLSRAHPALQIPEVVGGHYSIVPLEAAPSPVFGGMTGPLAMSYKGVSALHGTANTLLRIIGTPPTPSSQIVRAGDAWKRVRHPGILCLREVFTSRQFTSVGAPSLVPVNEVIFVYEFACRANTLFNVFLNGAPDRNYLPLSEVTLWAIATQLLSAIAIVHSNRLALRDALTTTRILLTGRNRVRISCVGLNDALDPGGGDHIPVSTPNRGNANQDNIAVLQRADLAAIGHVLATLALRMDPKIVRGGVLLCGEDVAVDTLRRLTPYTDDLTVLIMSLLSAAMPSSQVTTNQILGLIGPRIALELGNVWTHSDALERELFAEFDSSRMFRLMTLLGFVNERADAGVEPQWSETGDRYLLKLFRDYMFHRVDEDGNPILDMAHVIECLSRLDIGSQEQVLLSSRDGVSLLVATYEELRRCLMLSIDELRGIRHGVPTR